MKTETEEMVNHKQWAIDHVWTPLRPCDVLTAPDGFAIFTRGKGGCISDINGNEYVGNCRIHE